MKPGFRLGSLRFPGPLPKAGEPVRVVLGPPGKGEVRVEDPDGQPVAGARVRLEWFGQERINVPEAVEDLIEATTDKDGRAVIEAAANDEIAYVDVHAKGFGIQGQPFRPMTSQPKRVRLRPGRIARGSAPGRRPRHGQGLASPRLHVCRRSLVGRPSDDRLRRGDDRRAGTILLPRDRARAASGSWSSRPGTCRSWPRSQIRSR